MATLVDRLEEAEQAALDLDPRIVNSDGAEYEWSRTSVALANSHGFAGSYEKTGHGFWVVPIAGEGEDPSSMQRDYEYSVHCKASGLADFASVGRTAARRALRRLNARTIRTHLGGRGVGSRSTRGIHLAPRL